LVREGDLIINKIWVRHGSTAIATKAVDGCAASGEFPTFELDPSRAIPGWLHWQTKTRVFWGKCDALSRGTSGKNRIKPELFLTITVPLPPLCEQRRIVARIEELVAKVEEARALRRQAGEGCDILCRAILADTRDGDHTLTPMSELVTLREQDVSVQQEETYHFAGVYCFGRGVFSAQSKSGMDFAYRVLTRLRTGDFVYPKLMAWEGAFGVVPPECDGRVVSPEFPVFEVNGQKVRPEVLDVYFRDPAVWPVVAGQSTGTNVRRRRLNPRDFLSFRFPLPVASVQDRLCDVKRRMDALKQLQSDTAAELDALLPSILDQAFKGEL
jgi:type I restriction enzyme S subunit